MKRDHRISFADLLIELGVKNKHLNIPEQYTEPLREILIALDSEIDAIKNRVDVTNAYTEHLRNSVADKKPDQMLINMISGYETTFFCEALLDCGNGIREMILIYDTLYSFTERDEFRLIYCLIKSTYCDAGMHFPEFFDELLGNEDLFRDFMCEFLADLQEIILEESDDAILDESPYSFMDEL